MKRFVCVIFAWMLMCSLLVPARAAVSGDGSIEIRVKYEGTAVTGGDLIAVRVGYVDADNHIFRKFITNAEITGIGEAATVTQLQNFYTAYKSSFQFDVYKTEVKDGIGKFSEIPLGLYLVCQENAASGFSKLPAFLVTVPYKGNIHVSAASKTELSKAAVPVTVTSGSSGGQRLPQTGQLTWPVPWLAGVGMGLFVLGWWLCFGKNEDVQ